MAALDPHTCPKTGFVRAQCDHAIMFCVCVAGSGGLSQLLSDLQEPQDAAEYRIKIHVSNAGAGLGELNRVPHTAGGSHAAAVPP